jgi:hypothetical protein
MIVAIAPCIDEEIERLLRCVGQISVRLREFFANKSYGDDIETMSSRCARSELSADHAIRSPNPASKAATRMIG